MKHTAIFVCLLVSMAWTAAGQNESYPVEADDSLAFAHAEWEKTSLGKGAEAKYTQIDIFDSRQSICVIRYPARKFRSAFVHSPNRSASKTSVLAERARAEIAINGGYFDNGPVPCVYFRIGDEVYGETKSKEAEIRVNALIGFKDRKGHKIMIRRCGPDKYESIAGKWHAAMATGPLLIENEMIITPVSYAKAYPDRKIGSFYDGRNPRSAIGKDKKGNIYMVVIDGRHKGEGEGTTIYQTAVICKLLGMTEAINLDGGGSSALWSKDLGVINYPSDNRKFDHNGERTVPNIIIAY